LGEVDVSGGSRRTGKVSRYLVERFGFDGGALTWQVWVPFCSLTFFCADTVVAPFTADFLSTYLSLCPSPNDAVLSFGPMDILMILSSSIYSYTFV